MEHREPLHEGGATGQGGKPIDSIRISQQHAQLDELYRSVRCALDTAAVHTARRTFQRFHDAVVAHLSVEEELYFPTLETLRPAVRSELASIRAEHRDLRDRMREIAALLDGNERELSSQRLDELARAFATHERREEALLARVVRAGAAE